MADANPGEKIKVIHLVKFAALSNNETLEWMNRVAPYLENVKRVLGKTKLTKIFEKHLKFPKTIQKQFRKFQKKEYPKVSYLHTGSICQQVGRPGMPYQILTPRQEGTSMQPYPLMLTDHDVMFEETHIIVAEKWRGRGFWLKMNPLTDEFDCNHFQLLFLYFFAVNFCVPCLIFAPFGIITDCFYK